MEDFTRDELRRLHRWLDAYVGLCEKSGRVVDDLVALRDKSQRMIAERAGAPVKGPLVFVMELPLELCPTLNAYAKHEPWAQAKIRTAVDWRLVAAIAAQPRATLPRGGAPVKRWVKFTRHSSARVDEVTVDVLGGKIPVDRLVHARVISGDSAKHIIREAVWLPAKPGSGKGVIEVFDLA